MNDREFLRAMRIEPDRIPEPELSEIPLDSVTLPIAYGTDPFGDPIVILPEKTFEWIQATNDRMGREVRQLRVLRHWKPLLVTGWLTAAAFAALSVHLYLLYRGGR